MHTSSDGRGKQLRLGEVKYGKDEKLEKLANKLLSGSVRQNRRSVERDLEKMAYENGHLPEDQLQYYDPANDWDTQDEVFCIPVGPHAIDAIEPSLCIDDNVRERNRKAEERRSLSRLIDDEDDWGPVTEEIPLLGVNEGPRKTCARCKKAKGPVCFPPDRRNADGLHSWCRQCRKEATSQKRAKSQVRGRKRRRQ